MKGPALLVATADAVWARRLERAAGGLGLDFRRLPGGAPAAVVVAVVDWGPEAARVIAAVRSDLPGCVLALAAEGGGRAAEAAAQALGHGVDGVLDKGAAEESLAAGLRGLVRRARAAALERGLVSSEGGVRLEPASGRVSLRRRGLWRRGPALTAREAALLRLLLEAPGRVLGRSELLEALWGGRGGDVNSEALDKQAASLRRKLGPAGRSLRTVRGRGYRWG